MNFQNKFCWSTYKILKQVLLIYVWIFKTSSVDLCTNFHNKFYWFMYEISKQDLLICVWIFKTSSVDLRMTFQSKLCWSTHECSKKVLLIYVRIFKTSSIDLRMKFQNKFFWSTCEIIPCNHRHIYHVQQIRSNQYINHRIWDSSRRLQSRLGAGRLEKRG
jgi:hypothetical protein